MRDILEAIIEDQENRDDYEERERDFELERRVAHGSDDDLLKILKEFGY